MSQDWLFRVSNRHKASGGETDLVDGDTSGRYHGYFENEHGEQLIFVYDREAQQGMLRHGDAGWEREYQVTDGNAPALILSEEEKVWLLVCWKAATAFNKKS